MSRQTINTDAAPKSAAYSQAVVAAGLVFVSGPAALDPETGEIVGTTIQEQTRQCLKNVAAILDAAGSSLDKLVSATFILRDPGDFAGLNEEWLSWFPNDPPARQGAALPVACPGCWCPRGHRRGLTCLATPAVVHRHTGRPGCPQALRPPRRRVPDLPRFDPCARDEPSTTTRLSRAGWPSSATSLSSVRSARPEPPPATDLTTAPWWDEHTRPAAPRRPPALRHRRPVAAGRRHEADGTRAARTSRPARSGRARCRPARSGRGGGGIGLAVTCWWLVRGSAHDAPALPRRRRPGWFLPRPRSSRWPTRPVPARPPAHPPELRRGPSPSTSPARCGARASPCSTPERGWSTRSRLPAARVPGST